MKDWDTAVRCYTANSLGIIGKKELIPQLQIYINSEDSFEVKAELLAAQYRLGKAESLNDLLSLLAKADEDLAIVILNIFDDLLERKTPLITNIADICQVLKLIEQKFLILAPHSKNLIIKCEKINYF